MPSDASHIRLLRLLLLLLSLISLAGGVRMCGHGNNPRSPSPSSRVERTVMFTLSRRGHRRRAAAAARSVTQESCGLPAQ
jgi:hypothetical protein